MKTEKLLDAIGMIDDEIIVEANTDALNITHKPARRAWRISASLVAACIVFALVAVLVSRESALPELIDDFDLSVEDSNPVVNAVIDEDNNSAAHTITGTDATSNTEIANVKNSDEEIGNDVDKEIDSDERPSEIGGYGGDETRDFYFPFNINYTSIPGQFIDYVGEDKVDEWLAYLNVVNDNGSYSINLDFNLRNFVEYFGITKEEFREIYPGYDEEHDIGFTDEMLDAFYANDIEAMHRLFRNPYATFWNGTVYTPAWIVSHSYEEYIEEGLPISLISEVVEKCLEDGMFVYQMEQVKERIESKS